MALGYRMCSTSQLRCLRTAAFRPRIVHVACYKVEPENPNNSATHDKLRNTVPVKLPVREVKPFFDHAETELETYCSNVANVEEQLKCWRAYGFLRKKHRELEAGCSREKEGGQYGQKCDELIKLEQMIRELEYEGDLKSMYRTLSLLDDAETRKRQQQHPLSGDQLQEENSLLRERAAALFRKFDLDGNERMDVSEFREAFKQLNSELSGHEVQQICETMDLHGYVTKDQFVNVVVAEKFRLLYPDSDAAFLSKLSHERPNWWTERPNAIDNM